MSEKHPRYNKYARQRYTGGRPVFVSSQVKYPANTPGFGMMPPPIVGSKSFRVLRADAAENHGSVWQVHSKGVSGGLPKSVVVDSTMSFPRNTVLQSPTYQEYNARRSKNGVSSTQIKAQEAYHRDQEFDFGDYNHIPVDVGNHEVGLSPNSFFDLQADKAADLAIAREFGM